MKPRILSMLVALTVGLVFAVAVFSTTHDIETLINMIIGAAIGTTLGDLYLTGRLPLMKRTQDFPNLSLLLLGYLFVVLGVVTGIESLILGIATVKISLLSSSFTIMGALVLLYVYVKVGQKKTEKSRRNPTKWGTQR